MIENGSFQERKKQQGKQLRKGNINFTFLFFGGF